MIAEIGYDSIYDTVTAGYIKGSTQQMIIPIDEHQRIVTAFQKIKECDLADIKPEEKIYFHKSALFPRHKLKDFMSNAVTRKIERADYVVINKEQILYKISRVVSKSFYKDSNDNWVESPWLASYRSISSRFIVSRRRHSLDEHIEFYNNLEVLTTKKIIFDSSLNKLVPRDVNIRGELYEKIDKLLSGNDPINIKIGVDLLSNLDYNNNKNEVLMLLNKNYGHIRCYGSVHSVMFKSLIDVVSKDCPGWNTHNKLGFFLSLLETDPKNELIIKEATQHLYRAYQPKKGKYTLSLDVDI